jgi:hypothetical protein
MLTKPNIPVGAYNDKTRIKNLINEVVSDALFYNSFIPDLVYLDGVIFTLVLENKKFNFEELQVDNASEYLDIFLQDIKKTSDSYSVTTTDTNIVITFNQTITRRPQDIVPEDFLIKGKIVSI